MDFNLSCQLHKAISEWSNSAIRKCTFQTLLTTKPLFKSNLQNQSIHRYKTKHTDINIKHKFSKSWSLQYCPDNIYHIQCVLVDHCTKAFDMPDAQPASQPNITDHYTNSHLYNLNHKVRQIQQYSILKASELVTNWSGLLSMKKVNTKCLKVDLDWW